MTIRNSSFARHYKGKARAIRITPKGYAILALLDRGEYKTISTNEARNLAGIRGRRKARKLRLARR